MTYAIIGFGKIGQALAHAFARKNINVTVASAPRRAAVREASIGLSPSTLVKRHGSVPSPGPRHRSSRSRNARRKVEALFAELKNYIGLRRLRLRRMRFVREQFYLAATAQDLKRLVRFLSRKSTAQMAIA